METIFLSTYIRPSKKKMKKGKAMEKEKQKEERERKKAENMAATQEASAKLTNEKQET